MSTSLKRSAKLFNMLVREKKLKRNETRSPGRTSFIPVRSKSPSTPFCTLKVSETSLGARAANAIKSNWLFSLFLSAVFLIVKALRISRCFSSLCLSSEVISVLCNHFLFRPSPRRRNSLGKASPVFLIERRDDADSAHFWATVLAHRIFKGHQKQNMLRC